MNKITTLRQIAGLNNTLSKLSENIILIIDAQKEYLNGALPLFNIKESISAFSKFLKRARNLNIPIIHIIQINSENSKVFNPKGEFVEIIEEIKPLNNEIIIKKKFPSAFTETNLNEILKNFNTKNLIITGYMTHMCVNSTVRNATELGYNCTVIEELTTTRDLIIKEKIIPAEIVKSVHLAGLADRFVLVCQSANELED